MTDKEIAEKKNEYYEKFVGYDAYGELTDAEHEKLSIWQFIEELIKEVEKSQRKLIEQFFDNEERKDTEVPIELLVEAEKIDSYDEGWKDGYEAGQRSLN